MDQRKYQTRSKKKDQAATASGSRGAAHDLSFLHDVIECRPRPLAQALGRELRRAVIDGRLPDGTRLPPTRQLARDFGFSRNVAVETYAILAADGLLRQNRGGGTVVCGFEIARPTLTKLKSVLDFAAVPRPVVDDEVARQRTTLPPSVPDATQLRTKWWSCWRWAATRPVLGDYGNPWGERMLRDEIARRLSVTRGMSLDAEHVVITNGALEAIRLVARLVVRPGAWIAAENPGWPLARQALRQDGHDVRPAAVDLHGLDVERLSWEPEPPRLTIVTPAHQLPLGGRLPMERRTCLLRQVEASRGWIVEDDYDGEFRYDVPPLPSLASLAMSDRVIYVGSFSKTLTPQLRIGYLVGAPAFAEQIARLKQFMSYHASRIDQLALARFMAEGHFERHLARMRRIYSERRLRLVDALSHAPIKAEVRGINGGLHVYWRFPSRKSASMVDEALRYRGVNLLTIAHFTEGKVSWHGFAVGFGTARADASIESLSCAVQSLPQLLAEPAKSAPKRKC